MARDKDGNTTTSPTRQVSVPLDDQNAVFASAFSGAWGTPTVGGDFQGAVHWVSLSEDPTATFTYSFNGTYVGWIAHPGLENPSTANVVIDGGLPQSVDLWASAGPRKLVFERTLSPGAHTITISVVAGRITVDGLVVR